MRTSGGRGGLGRVRTPPDEGGGGQKGQIFADVLYGLPLLTNPPPPSGADVLYGWPLRCFRYTCRVSGRCDKRSRGCVILVADFIGRCGIGGVDCFVFVVGFDW